MRRLLSLGLLILLLSFVAGCGGGTPAPSTISGVRGLAGLHWIITSSALSQIRRLDPALAQAAFDNPSTYLLGGSRGGGIPSGWSSIPTAGYKSYAQLSSDFADGSFPSNVRAVLYDNEAWAFTPAGEQLDPAHYTQLAAALCHQHGLQLIATPALDLVRALVPTSSDRSQTYLDLRIAAGAAQSADVIDIQAQSLEADTAAYAAFVESAAQQARQAGGARVLVLAGLSTGPGGKSVTAAQLEAAVSATRSSVDGYWLNVPAQGPDCPTCTEARPDLAVSFLRVLSGG